MFRYHPSNKRCTEKWIYVFSYCSSNPKCFLSNQSCTTHFVTACLYWCLGMLEKSEKYLRKTAQYWLFNRIGISRRIGTKNWHRRIHFKKDLRLLTRTLNKVNVIGSIILSSTNSWGLGSRKKLKVAFVKGQLWRC